MPVPDDRSVILESHEEGVTPITITGEWEHARLVRQPLARTIMRLGLPAVASTLLMTLFFTVDLLWIGRFLGPVALAAATASVFWIWLIISIAELVSAIPRRQLASSARRWCIRSSSAPRSRSSGLCCWIISSQQ